MRTHGVNLADADEARGTPQTRSARHRVHDIRGLGKLAVEATTGLTALVEAMHHNISRAPGPLGTFSEGKTTGLTGLVYRSVRGVTRLVGTGVDAALLELAPLLGQAEPSPGREALVAALNGVLGDYLEGAGNPLAIQMRLRRDGSPLELTKEALAALRPTGRLLLLNHGLCMCDLGLRREGHDHGDALARDLGYTPVYLHYNTGLHVSTNGKALAGLLETLVTSWPVPLEDFAILAHSMGGLVARSAIHYGDGARHGWRRQLRRVVFLGTPHHGSPLERLGNVVGGALGISPYTAAFVRLGKLRSAGITDLRHGSLLDEDWAGHDRFARGGDLRQPVPLPEDVACYAIAATTSVAPGGAAATNVARELKAHLFGDGLVPVGSALGRHADPARALAFPESRTWVASGAGHFDLLNRPDVYGRVHEWLAAESAPALTSAAPPW